MSKADTWMPLYISDYLRDTMHLNAEKHGAYMLLLMACWTRGGSLPNDDDQLADIARVPLPVWRKMRSVILAFFDVDGDQIIQGRVVVEWEKARALSAKRREIGSKGGRPRKQPETNSESKPKPIGLANGNQTGLQTETPSPSPLPTEVKEVAKATLSSGDDEVADPKRKRRAYPDEFEAAWKAYPHVEGRSAKPRALEAWKALPADERAGLMGAIARFIPKVNEVCGGKGAPCMGRWLKDGKHLSWIRSQGQAFPPVDLSTWPEERWAAVVERWRLTGLWNDRLGPAPDRPDTHVPVNLRPSPADRQPRTAA